MEITIRSAKKEDCQRLLELIDELAQFEKAPQEVTVTLDHFIESGFGPNPVYWAFVASVDDPDRRLPPHDPKAPRTQLRKTARPHPDRSRRSRLRRLSNTLADQIREQAEGFQNAGSVSAARR